MEDRTGFERALVVAAMILIGLAAVGVHDTVVRTCAVLAAVALWPAGLLQRLLAALLRTVLLKELRKTQTGLKLDSIHRHDIAPLKPTMGIVYGPQWLTP
jgi:hypothetical protein